MADRLSNLILNVAPQSSRHQEMTERNIRKLNDGMSKAIPRILTNVGHAHGTPSNVRYTERFCGHRKHLVRSLASLATPLAYRTDAEIQNDVTLLGSVAVRKYREMSQPIFASSPTILVMHCCHHG